MKNGYLIPGLFCLLLMVGCRKDKIDDRVQLAGRWSVESLADKQFIDDIEQLPSRKITEGTAADYVEFDPDGGVVMQLDGKIRRGSITSAGGKRIVRLDSRNYTILELSQTGIVMKAIDSGRYGDNSYRMESTLRLRK